jgi:hypothetical protein
MKILLRWLVDHVWIFYVACAIGALIYLVRALVAQRERSLALFTLEHETATVRAVRAWAMMFVFIAAALMVFIGVTFALPRLPAINPESPLPTSTPSSGVDLPSATVPVTGSVAMPTFPAQTATPVATAPPPSPTTPPTLGPTDTPTATPMAAGAVSGEMNVAFGDFGRLIGYSLSSGQITVGEPLLLTLYWQALEGQSPTDYTVFTHLLSQDGSLIAQHDGPPAGGNEPTGQWQAGETIEDTHEMAFLSGNEDYAGPATIAVGLYDPANMSARVATSEGLDYVSLPVTINVLPR